MNNKERKPNNLIKEKSPYLLQHAYNPINWYSWGEEAFKKAKEEDKPIFLSIGYSTCHWCHVMERESFEDYEVAEYMNKYFIAIKVDREERPDIDSVYMTVCQSLTGHGGWPLTIVMTPDQKPFYAGTYFPKNSRYNLPGLMDVLKTVVVQWKDNRKNILSASSNIESHLNDYYNIKTSEKKLNKDILDRAYRQFWDYFDQRDGGFGESPKFPTPHNLIYLLRYYKVTGQKPALEMVEKTLDSMYKGGIFDHIGYGFSRYSTDRYWLVPHFEKMLYDNALLIMAYLEGYEVTKKEYYRSIAKKVIEYVFRELTSPEGGFYSAEDADSEGEEGKYYVFNPLEIIDILGEKEGEYFNRYFDITVSGNFEGKNIPNLIKNREFNIENETINNLRERVLEYRSKRTRLHKDDKILTSWNGLMIAALGRAYKVIGDEKYLNMAEKAVNFIYDNLFNSKGRLLARYREGEALYNGYLDDYAFLVWGLLELYEGSYNIDYLKRAINLNREMISLFWDEKNKGFYLYGEDSEQLIARPKEIYDGAIPSGNSVAACNLIKLARMTGEVKIDEIASQQLNFIYSAIEGGEISYSFFLIAAISAVTPSKELIAVLSDNNDIESIKNIMRENENFNLTILVKTKDNEKELAEIAEFTKGYGLKNDMTTYYICKSNSCSAPFNDIRILSNELV